MDTRGDYLAIWNQLKFIKMVSALFAWNSVQFAGNLNLRSQNMNENLLSADTKSASYFKMLQAK